MKDQFKGILWVTVSAVCFGSYGIWSKLIGTSLGAFSQAWMRGVILLLFFILWESVKILQHADVRSDLVKRLNNIVKSRSDLRVLFVIAFCGALNQAPDFYAFQHLDIGTVTILFYVGLLLGGILVGIGILKEPVTKRLVVSCVLAIVGLGCLYPLFLSEKTILAALAAVAAGVMGGTEVALTKKVSDRYTTKYILIFIYSFQVVGNLLLSGVFGEVTLWSNLSGQVVLGLIGHAAAMLVAMASVFYGFRYVSATVGSIVGLSEVLFALVFGVVLFGEHIGMGTIIGASCIVVATVCVVRIEGKR